MSQTCYSQPGCVGDIVEVPGPSARNCCAGTDEGQSYSADGVNCDVSQCIGSYATTQMRVHWEHAFILENANEFFTAIMHLSLKDYQFFCYWHYGFYVLEY